MSSELETLLHGNKTISVHMQNLQLLIIDVYQAKSNLNLLFIKEINREEELFSSQ